jgi:hypothetical protein
LLLLPPPWEGCGGSWSGSNRGLCTPRKPTADGGASKCGERGGGADKWPPLDAVEPRRDGDGERQMLGDDSPDQIDW